MCFLWIYVFHSQNHKVPEETETEALIEFYLEEMQVATDTYNTGVDMVLAGYQRGFDFERGLGMSIAEDNMF